MYIYTLPMIHIDYMADETLKAGISGSGELKSATLVWSHETEHIILYLEEGSLMQTKH